MRISSASALWALMPLLSHAKDCRPPVESEKLQELITVDG